MATVRETAAMLAREGRLQVTQRGRVLPIDQPWHGPVRFRRPPGRSPHR
jgi:hypothetical protein